jgi:hypothetical protein
MQTFALKKELFSRQKGYNQNIKTINLHSEIQTNVKKKYILNLIRLQIILPLAKVQLHFTIKAKCL